MLKSKKYVLPGLMALSAVMLVGNEVVAGTTGTEFQAAYNWLVGALEGYGGKIAAVLALFVGLFIAVWTKSLMPPLIGLGIAFFIAYGVALINGIATAVI